MTDNDRMLPILRSCLYPHTLVELHRVFGGNIKALDNRLRKWVRSGVIGRKLEQVGPNRVWYYSVQRGT